MSSRVYSSKKKNSKKGSKKNSKKCSKGQIMRLGYTTNSGKTVEPGCIIARSASGKKTSDKLKKYIEKKESMHKKARKIFSKEGSKKCSKGYIMREGYKVGSHKSHSKSGKITNVKSHWVSPNCIKSQLNKSSKGQKTIVLMEKDILKPFGYSQIESMTKSERRNALKKAIKKIKPLSVYRRIIAIATLNKNKNEKLYQMLRDDADWIKTQKEYLDNMANKDNKVVSKKSSKKKSKK